jgi:hypothetical protein
MNSNNSIQRSWWRRLARRTRAEAPRTNRLSHFEPLEQRTVMSASVFVQGDDFFRAPHEPHQFDAGLDRYAIAPHHEFAYHDTSYAPHSAVPEPLYAPQSLAPPSMLMGASLREFEPEPHSRLDSRLTGGEGESNSSLASSTPAFIGPIFQTSTAYKVEIVIVHDEAANTSAAAAIVFAPAAPPRITLLTPVYISAVDTGVFASLGAAAAMQRRVEAPSYSYTGQSRLGSLSAMSEEAGSTTGKSLESTLQTTSGSLLATLGNGSGATANSAHVSMSDDGGSSEHVLSQNAASRPAGEETDGLTELTAADLAAEKRKLALGSEARTPVQTQLEDLTDIPVIRITESLFRELLVQYENSAPVSQQPAQPVSDADDGMIELIAVDVGAVAARHSTPVNDPSQPVVADSGIALYQTLEVAGLDDIAEVAAAVQTQAAPVAPAEQIAKAE